MIEVTENDNGTFTISWDENDPQESIFNTWTEQDFINAITDYLNSLEKSGEVDYDQKIGQSIEEVTHFIEGYDKNYEEDDNYTEIKDPNYTEIKDPDNWYEIKFKEINHYVEETNEETYGDQGIE